MTITILDGPMGSQLIARGVPAPAPLWSAWAVQHEPEAVVALHREYAAAGATVHTANTFRTKRRSFGPGWEVVARRAVALAREAVPAEHRVAGSIAPLEDCYRPDLSPSEPQAEHRELADVLADAGVDLLLCETFPHPGEAAAAVAAATATGLETWVALTAGPRADLLSPTALGEAASPCVAAGAAALLVNCVPAKQSLPFVHALTGLGVPVGVYANGGAPEDGIGWGQGPDQASRYLDYARQWVAAGATLVGSCCGTGPEHIRALAEAFASA